MFGMKFLTYLGFAQTREPDGELSGLPLATGVGVFLGIMALLYLVGRLVPMAGLR